ncbi:hypothetical protein Vafri_20635 [Volvox africanus]|uniref:Rubisco LSMT substrate-binding domain-containing protein n=1 Tax=Volvox africanus TaxID=51714 RepID=A0A8J4BRX1_9CHLO|nr:hypothetical protein Vafri_20635 [Volvox africanus]
MRSHPVFVRQSTHLTSQFRPRSITCLAIHTASQNEFIKTTSCISETSCRLFDQLAAEHCPVVRVSLAHFPRGGLGWTLRQDSDIPLPLQSHHLTEPSHPSSSSPAAPTLQARRASANPNPNTSRTDLDLIPTSPVKGSDSKSSADVRSGSVLRSRSRSSHDGDFTHRTLLSVPLRLCLSHEVTGCCPPALHSPALRSILSADSSLPWEVPLAAMLLWSCRRLRVAVTADATTATGADADAARTTGAAAAATAALMPRGKDGAGTDGHNGAGADEVAGQHGDYGMYDGGGGGDGGFSQFWRSYRALLPPGPQDLNTLLLFDEWELRELQDPSLAAEARAWQGVVRQAYDRWITCDTFKSEVGGEVPFSEWLWAVGCVESRAFGFRADDDGRELHAYVPFFCLANYEPGAPTFHVLQLNAPDIGRPPAVLSSVLAPGKGFPRQMYDKASCRTTDGSWEPSVDMIQILAPNRHSTEWLKEPVQDLEDSRHRDHRGDLSEGEIRSQSEPRSVLVPEHQVFIDYGKKDNRSLLYQYGFILCGNPYDRLDWGGMVFNSSCRMRRDWVYGMAEKLIGRGFGADSNEASSPQLPTTTCLGSVPDTVSSSDNPPLRTPQMDAPGTLALSYRTWDVSCGYDTACHTPGNEFLVGTGEGLHLLLDVNGGMPAVRRRFRSAAASIVEACGWRNLRERRLVCRESEERTLLLLSSWVAEQLRAFPTAAEEDLQLLVGWAAGGAAGVVRGPVRVGGAHDCTEEENLQKPSKTFTPSCSSSLSCCSSTSTSTSLPFCEGSCEVGGDDTGEISKHTACRVPASASRAATVIRDAMGSGRGDREGQPPPPPTTTETTTTETRSVLRQRLAVEYRLERKLLLHSALVLLQELNSSLQEQKQQERDVPAGVVQAVHKTQSRDDSP